MPRVTIVVPTLNEAENLDPLLAAVFEHARAESLDLEVVVVDDGSTDSTRAKARAWGERAPVRLVARDHEKGLSTAVLAGASAAASDVVVVMDADGSHPADRIAALARPVLDGTCDMAVGSRYIPGGTIEEWPLRRRIVSRGAAFLASALTDVRDPLSGFFAVGRDALLENGRDAVGYKIGLQVLVSAGPALRVAEVPITFRDRTRGASKLGAGTMLAYLRQLAAFIGCRLPRATVTRMGVVALAALAVDVILCNILVATGFALSRAHIASFSLGVVLQLASLPGLVGLPLRSGAPSWGAPGLLWRCGPFFTVAVLALFLRGGVLTLLTDACGWLPVFATLGAALASSIVCQIGWTLTVFASRSSGPSGASRWIAIAVGLAAYLTVFRLLHLGQISLIPQEAYYWNYSQHLDIGYLDHPPMVAWLIWLTTSIFGNTELAVRLPTQGTWALALVFAFLLTRNLFGSRSAFVVSSALAALPFFFFTGALITPDAPLVPAWAGALYFLERALLGQKRWAWWFVGLSIGIGMLSKYTIALLGLATLVYVILDVRSWRWLLAPEVYGGALLSGLVTLPVIIWNARNDWASFTFQGARRWSESGGFGTHELLLFVVIILTPTALVACVIALWFGIGTGTASAAEPRSGNVSKSRRLRFVRVFTLVPLAVFVTFSIQERTRMNWTGPIWLAALPAASAMLVAARAPLLRGARFLRGAWNPTLVALGVLYGCVTLSLLLDERERVIPLDHLVDWPELGRAVADVETRLVESTGEQPLVVGLDKYNLSSELAFYNANGSGASKTAGRHLVGRDALMYEYWFPKDDQEHKNVILVSKRRSRLEVPDLLQSFNNCAAIEEITLRDGSDGTKFYFRIGYGYRPNPR